MPRDAHEPRARRAPHRRQHVTASRAKRHRPAAGWLPRRRSRRLRPGRQPPARRRPRRARRRRPCERQVTGTFEPAAIARQDGDDVPRGVRREHRSRPRPRVPPSTSTFTPSSFRAAYGAHAEPRRVQRRQEDSVSTVAITMPPIIATAIGPKKSLRTSGISASTAAAAVSTIGRKRRTVAPTTASHGACPAAMSWSIWSTRMIELRMMMPGERDRPEHARRSRTACRTRAARATTPMRPSGAVSTTISRARETLQLEHEQRQHRDARAAACRRRSIAGRAPNPRWRRPISIR